MAPYHASIPPAFARRLPSGYVLAPPMSEDARKAPSQTHGGDRYGYEFSDAHKESFAALARSVVFLGVCALLLAAVSVLGALGALVEGYPWVALGAAVGVAVYAMAAGWMLSAGRSLSAMLRTRGRDIELLMQAIAQLRRIFALAVATTLLLVAAGMGVALCAATGLKCWGLLT